MMMMITAMVMKDSMKPLDRSEQLQEELMMCEQELEFTLTKQRGRSEGGGGADS